MNTDELRAALHRDADLAGRPGPDLLDQVVARRRRTRHRRVGIAAGCIAAVIVVAGVPAVMQAWPQSGVDSVANLAQADLLNATTRGSLATETALVQAVRQLDWTASASAPVPVSTPLLDSRTVVFLGDVADTRIALVAGARDGRTYTAWFTGAAGSPADQLELVQAGAYVAQARPSTTVDLHAAHPIAIAMSAPGDDIEFSTKAILASDGTITRTYEQGADVADGIAAWPISPGSVAALSYRVSRGGVVTYRSMPESYDGPVGADPAGETAPVYDDARGLSAPVDGRMVAGMITEVSTGLQLPAEELSPVLLWAGTVPGPATTTNTAIALGYTTPSGATIVQETAFVDHGDAGYGILPGTWQSFPAGTPVDQQPLLIRNTLGDGTVDQQITSSLLAIGPAEAVQGRLLDAKGTELVTASLTAGAAALADHAEADRIEFVAVSGDVLATVGLSPAYDVHVYDQGNGPA